MLPWFCSCVYTLDQKRLCEIFYCPHTRVPHSAFGRCDAAVIKNGRLRVAMLELQHRFLAFCSICSMQTQDPPSPCERLMTTVCIALIHKSINESTKVNKESVSTCTAMIVSVECGTGECWFCVQMMIIDPKGRHRLFRTEPNGASLLKLANFKGALCENGRQAAKEI